MKKRNVLLSIVMLMLTMMLTACSSMELADTFDEETVKSSAENVITLLSAGDYDGVVETFSDAMKEALPADVLESNVGSLLTEAGNLEEFTSISVIGQKNAQTDEDNAVAVVIAKYENKQYTYTLSYSPDMKVSGLYFK